MATSTTSASSVALALVLAELVGDAGGAVGGLGGLDGGAEDEAQALLGQQPLQGLADLEVHAGGDLVEVLEDGDLAAEAGIDRAELEADDAGADDGEALGDLGELEGAGGADDRLLVDGARRLSGRDLGAAGDDDVLRLVRGAVDARPRRGRGSWPSPSASRSCSS